MFIQTSRLSHGLCSCWESIWEDMIPHLFVCTSSFSTCFWPAAIVPKCVKFSHFHTVGCWMQWPGHSLVSYHNSGGSFNCPCFCLFVCLFFFFNFSWRFIFYFTSFFSALALLYDVSMSAGRHCDATPFQSSSFMENKSDGPRPFQETH